MSQPISIAVPIVKGPSDTTATPSDKGKSPHVQPLQLASEVLRDIILLTARMDPKMVPVLSCVSRSVHELLAPEMRKTRIITTPRALQAFWTRIELEQLLPLVVDQWGLPAAFAEALTEKVDDVAAALEVAGVPISPVKLTGLSAVKQTPHPVLAGRHAVPPVAKRVLQDQFGCTIPSGSWIDSLQKQRESQPSFTIDSLYPSLPSTLPTQPEPRSKQPTWTKSDTPLGPAIENLFIDISRDPASSPSVSPSPPASSPPTGALGQGFDADDAEEGVFGAGVPGGEDARPDLFTLVDLLDDQRQRLAAILSGILEDSGAPWHLVQKMYQLPARHGRSLAHLLEHLPSLERLSLGAAEMQLFSPSFSHPTLTPSELTAVYDGTTEPLVDLVRSHGDARPVRLAPSREQRNKVNKILSALSDSFHAQPASASPTLASGTWPVRVRPPEPAEAALEALPHFQLVGIRQRLTKVHLIGLDPHGPMVGVPVPIASLDALRAGSVSPHSYLACCLAALRRNGQGEEEPESDTVLSRNEVSTGATHIRYSTRRFGLRPVETTASQLRVFVQELAADRVFSLPSADGARKKERDPLVDCLLAEWGVGGFERLGISWAPREEYARQAQARASLHKRFNAESTSPGSSPLPGDEANTALPSTPLSSISPEPAGREGSPPSPTLPRATAKVIGPQPRGSRLTEAQRRRAMAVVVRSPRLPRSPPTGRTSLPAGDEENGGWSAEHKDVWTDELLGGGAPFPVESPTPGATRFGPGMAGSGGGSERLAATAADAFAGELKEGIRQIYGWDRAPPWDMRSSFMQKLRSGALLDPASSRSVWSELESYLGGLRWASRQAALTAIQGIVPGLDDEDHIWPWPTNTPTRPRQTPTAGQQWRHDPDVGASQLHFDIHVPATFMQFGGTAPFSKSARLDLFLDNIVRGDASWS